MKRLCMIVHSYFPEDPRVRRETEAAVRGGFEVDVICLRNTSEKKFETSSGAKVYRLPIKRHRASGRLTYLFEYLAFFALAFLKVTALHAKRRYSIIQAHNIPDAIVFVGYIPKLLGAKVALDLHELMPELFAAKYELAPESRSLKLVRAMEKYSVRFADHLIVANFGFAERLIGRGVPGGKITVIVNSPNMSFFGSAKSRAISEKTTLKKNRTCTLVFHGTIADRYGLDVAIKAVHLLRRRIPDIQLNIYGRGEALDSLKTLASSLNVARQVCFHDYMEMSELSKVISRADMGIVPLQNNDHTELAFPTKLFDYVALKIPSVVARTPAIAEVFSSKAVAYFTPGDHNELAKRISDLYFDDQSAAMLAKIAYQEFQPHRWEIIEKNYINLLSQFTSRELLS